MKMGDLEVENKTDAEFVLGITVSGADGESQTLSWGYDQVKMDMEMMGQKMSYDSASPEGGNAMLAPVFKSLTGRLLAPSAKPSPCSRRSARRSAS